MIEKDIEAATREIGITIATARKSAEKKIEELAEETRINPVYLRKIEAGDFKFLPRPYVVAYLKTFAGKVGLDGEKLIERWRLAEAGPAPEEAQPSPTKAARPPVKKHLARSLQSHAAAADGSSSDGLEVSRYFKEISMGVGIVAVLIILFILSLGPRKSPSPSNTIVETESEQTAPITEIPFEQMVSEQRDRFQTATADMPPPAEEAPPRQEKLQLLLKANNDVWLKVNRDGLEENEYTFRAGHSITWEANEYFEFRIGNAAGVSLALNGRDLGAIGQAGQVATLRITKDGIANIRRYKPRKVAPDSLAAPGASANARRDTTKTD